MTSQPTDPVFISYRHSDGTDIAAELSWLLRAGGIPVWRDRDDLPPGDTEQRLSEAMSAGLSGAVLVITPDVAKSEVIQHVESPHLIKLHADHPTFVLGITNAIKRDTGGLDYDAPDRVLLKRPGTLSGVDQAGANRDGLIKLVGKVIFHRIAAQREVNGCGDAIKISLQTRNTPQVYDRTGSELDIRIRPNSHERLPSVPGLRDLAEVLRFLPDAVTRSSAKRVQVSGGAHLSVACALGAALPSSRVGHLEVTDQRGHTWAGTTEARLPSPSQLVEAGRGVNHDWNGSGRPKVLAYVDLISPRSDAAYDRCIDEQGDTLAAWVHLRPISEGMLDPDAAGDVAAEVAYRLRTLSAANDNAEIHLLLRCPFPMAVLIGRLCNTLRLTAYEWDDTDSAEGNDYRPRYVPTLKIRPSATTGAIEEVLPTH